MNSGCLAFASAIGLLSLTSAAPSQNVAPQAYIKASNTGGGDNFGLTMDMEADTLVVGACCEKSNSAGVNGDQSNDSFLGAGAAYVLVRDAASWTQQAYLKASNVSPFDEFATTVAISGDTIVVGAIGEDSSAIGVNGEQSLNDANRAGAAYAFVRDGDSWSQQAYLKASNTQAEDRFGRAVAISGDTIVVGARWEDSSATGVNGSQLDGTPTSGAAYVFVRDGDSWSQQAYLKASNTGVGDEFASAVAIDGDTILIGALGESSAAAGVNGEEADDSLPNAGAVYVFTRTGTTWSQEAYLKASNPDADDEFGSALALDGDTAIVGVPFESSATTGVDGDQADNAAEWAGAAYVFARSGTTWSQQAYLKASNTDVFDRFGYDVALDGDTILIGAVTEASSAINVDGLQADNPFLNAGAAYLFENDAGVWSQSHYLKASNTDEFDLFGTSVALSGTTACVGANRERGATTGFNGDQADNNSADAGAVYAFDLDTAWTDLGSALAGALGLARLVGAGSLAGGSVNAIDLSNAAPRALAGLFLGVDPQQTVNFKQGRLVPAPVLKVLFANTSAAGTLPLDFAWPLGAPPGFNLYAQWVITDASAPAGVSLSNAVRGTTP